MQPNFDPITILSQIQTNFKSLHSQHQYIIDAVQFLQNILTQYPNSTFISFNGGKDATIVLVLTYLALRNIQSKNINTNLNNKINSVFKMPEGLYFQEPNPFPEMMDFYLKMVAVFNLKMHTLNSKKYAQQLTNFANMRQFDFSIMGSRNDDPYCEHLQLITQSDTNKGYPAFKRINPIVKWDYNKVWTTIKILQIPYCSLYQEGYSSIGNRDNTVKNPTLVCQNNRCKAPFQANPNTQRICRVSDKK